MTGLLELVSSRDARGVAEALQGLPEAERRAFAPELLETARTLAASDDWHVLDQIPAVQVALAGTATFTEIRRTGQWAAARVEPQHGAAVLLDRRPPWLAEYAEWLLRADTNWPPWFLVRPLVLAGAIDAPPAPLYLSALIGVGRQGRAEQLVTDDPALLEHELWALLTSDTGQDSLRAADTENEWVAGAGWNRLIQTRVADARLPHERVLDAVLDGLANDMVAYRVPWHTKLWKDLAPTREERAERADRLRVLLGAATEPIVAFAVEELGRAEVEVPPGDLAPALAASAKKTVRGALKLLRDAPEVATIALGHPDAGLQGEVLDRLERWALDDAARAALLRLVDGVSATQRPRVEALLGVALTPAADTVEVDVADIPDAIRAALNFGGPLPPAPIPGEPVLGEPIAPMTTLEELAEALETLHTVDERLLDAILRHCGTREPFEGVLAPHVEQLRRFSSWRECSIPAHVAAAWLTGEMPELGDAPDAWRRRLLAAARRAALGEAGALLALPTHEGGWIEPHALVARLRDAGEPDEFELAQALLRLAPDGRAEALDAAADLPGRAGAVLRCALGGDPVEDDGPAATTALVVAGLVPLSVDVTFDADAERMIEAFVATHDAPRVDGPLADHLTALGSAVKYTLGDTADAHGYPARRDIAAAGGINRFGWNLGNEYTLLSGALDLFPVLLRPREPIAPLTARFIVLALGSWDERESLLAVDVLIAAIEDGRLDVLPPDDVHAIKPNRLAAKLQTIAGAGPLHGAVVRDFLDAAIEHAPARSGPLLTLFDELCAQTGTGPNRSREYLRTLSHKAAKALVKRTGDPPDSEAQFAVAARARRAYRWMQT